MLEHRFSIKGKKGEREREGCTCNYREIDETLQHVPTIVELPVHACFALIISSVYVLAIKRHSKTNCRVR